jgi:hypothetical protein
MIRGRALVRAFGTHVASGDGLLVALLGCSASTAPARWMLTGRLGKTADHMLDLWYAETTPTSVQAIGRSTL